MGRKIEQVLKFASVYKAAQEINYPGEPTVNNIIGKCNVIRNLIDPGDAFNSMLIDSLLKEAGKIGNELSGFYAKNDKDMDRWINININQILYNMDKIANKIFNEISGHENETAIKRELESMNESIKNLDKFITDAISNSPQNKMLY